jgi:phosphoadenosine phosphosulfate reductase
MVARTRRAVSPEHFANYSPVDRIKCIYDIHGEKAIQLASMQKTAGVIMHLIHRAKVPIPIFFFDTQYLHQETHDVKNEFETRYGLDIRTVTPELTVEMQDRVHGKDLFATKEGQLQCCYMRKEQPLIKTIADIGAEATLAGLTRKEGGARANIQPVGHDPRNGLALYYPLFDFNNEMIHAYTKKHDLPVHALYAQNFLSIGCAPCTTPVKVPTLLIST